VILSYLRCRQRPRTAPLYLTYRLLLQKHLWLAIVVGTRESKVVTRLVAQSFERPKLLQTTRQHLNTLSARWRPQWSHQR
jgi:hypothetical protein